MLAAGLASLALLTAGCGGGSKAPSVASLGTTSGATTAATSAAAAGGGGPARAGSVVFSGVGVAAFSSCMRSHGVPDFPDPNSQGMVSISASSGVGMNSPRFQAAEKACGSLMPGPTPGEAAQDEAHALRYSACMRSHGVPTFPDPTFSGGDIAIMPRGIDQRSPLYRSAQKACQSNLPGLPG